MSKGNWNEVLSAYKYAQKESWREDLVWMDIFISENHEEIYDKPLLSIELSNEQREHIKDKFRFKFSLTTGIEDGNLFRENVESIYCSFEKSLEVFDEMIEKLKEVSK